MLNAVNFLRPAPTTQAYYISSDCTYFGTHLLIPVREVCGKC
jgi:hypothetical protein